MQIIIIIFLKQSISSKITLILFSFIVWFDLSDIVCSVYIHILHSLSDIVWSSYSYI